jgi:hypothetical protein
MLESPMLTRLVAETLHRAILAILEARFPPIPRDLPRRLRKILDEPRLQQLILLAAKCPDLSAFRESLVAGSRCTFTPLGERMSIQAIVEAFLRLPRVRTGRGPGHPEEPDPAWEQSLTDLVRNHPYLQRYPDYVEFVRMNLGALIERPDDDEPGVSLLIYGVGEYDDSVAAPVNEEGIFIFSIVEFWPQNGSVRERVFGFDATGTRTAGVYQLVEPPLPGRARAYQLYCPTFADWLREVVATGGRLPIQFSEPPRPEA